MPYNYYQAPPPESLSPAYQLLQSAIMAKADALGHVLDPLTQAIRANRQEALQGRALDVREKETQAEAAWKKRYGDQQDEEIGLRRREMDSKDARSAAWAKSMYGGGGTPADGSVGGGGGPNGSAGGKLDPRALLGGSQRQFLHLDEATARALGPDDAMRAESMFSQIAERERHDQEAALKQKQDAQEIAGAHANIDALGDDVAPKSLKAQMKLRVVDGASAKDVNKEITGILETVHAKEMAQAELDAMIPETEKLLKEARPGDLQGLARLKAFKKVQGHTASDPRKDLELFKKERAEILGTKDPKAEGDKGIDLPGIGMNVSLNTALAKGGTYKVGEDGKPVLPKDIDAELTGLAQQSLRSDPGFASSLGRLAEVAGADKDLTSAFEKMEAKLIDREKRRLLDTFKWEAEPQAEKPKSAEAPKQSVAPANAPPPIFSSEYPEQTKAIVEMWKTDPEAAIREIVKLRKGTGATPAAPRVQRDHPLGGQGPF